MNCGRGIGKERDVASFFCPVEYSISSMQGGGFFLVFLLILEFSKKKDILDIPASCETAFSTIS